jgi:hypothetical protein
VSVAEISPQGAEYERTPPHDLAAEQCVLGGMLMSKDAIADVLETTTGPRTSSSMRRSWTCTGAASLPTR